MAGQTTLHLLCGRIASGKSTLATELGRRPRTVVIREDHWLSGLFGKELKSIDDYVRCAGLLRGIVGPHVTDLLNAGVSVVLDFQANTIVARSWIRGLLGGTEAAHVLHLLDVPEEVCLARLRTRNKAGLHPFVVTEAQFRQVTRHFVPPAPEEGFAVQVHPVATR
ncbi:AAA family ATPase [Limimaricola cinnabarinus]|uniref:AAA family ATPase n=1 Tax=Limimaricola cinnabarinus TaxID=1125964 RepID=UPI0024904174|nr:ATP-binding protein [Limimaricola cinnabarinus]